MSHSGIVSKRLNVSENFFDHLKAPSFWFLETPAPIPIPRGTPSSGALNKQGWEKLAIFVRFSTEADVYLGNGTR